MAPEPTANGHVNGNGNGNGHVHPVLRVGLIGCGEIAQVAHISTLNFLSEYFEVSYLCDVSEQALAHCALKVAGTRRPRTTKDAKELCESSDVDVVIVCSATPLHPEHAILALQNNKHVLVEKPLALCQRDYDAIEAAEKVSKATVFVGYMRRYAPAFLDAIAEVGEKSKIQYARVRDIIGLNSYFVDQSGTFPKRFSDVSAEDSESLRVADDSITKTALMSEMGVPVNADTKRMLAVLGGLGTHDLSAMREALGMPVAVKGSNLQWPIWSALLQYENFAVVYESGINSVPVFDAHIEIYTDTKIVRVQYDSPYVKGLPITMTVRELGKSPRGEDCYTERIVRTTYEDTYTIEFKEWYSCIMEGRTPKTTVADARNDLGIIKMLMQSAFAQQS